jgi:hypothetical protein
MTSRKTSSLAATTRSANDRTAYMRTVAAETRSVLSPDMRAALAASIRRDPTRQREEAAIAHGRFALIEGRWGQVAAVFTQLLRTGELRTRGVALLGLLSAGGKTRIERLINAMGRHSLPSRRHLASCTATPPASLRDRSLLR